jgi:starch synthase
MRVVMLAAEASPWAKTGGLADVVAALPRALQRLGADVTVCIPGHRSARAGLGPAAAGPRLAAPVLGRAEPFEVLGLPEAPTSTVLVRADRYFDRDGIYGNSPASDYGDNGERFAFFCRAALEWLRTLDPPSDVLHVHDWPAALAPALLRADAGRYPELARLRTVTTVHNLAYQGRFPAAAWPLLDLDGRFFTSEYLEFHGDVSYLKAGLVFSDAVTIVSRRYAEQARTPEFGHGLDGVLRARGGAVRGILNGIDEEAWNPATDPHLAARYDVRDPRGKATCRQALQAEMGLERRTEPALLGVVSRLVEQKGLDLLADAIPPLASSGEAQFAILGDGEPRLAGLLHDLAERFHGRVAVRLGLDEGLAHRIEAGADVLVVPSRFEPCGLTQLYALRYGTVPVVHATGGLDDTVDEFDPQRGTGTGFKFTPHTPEALTAALRRALAIRGEPLAWSRLMANGMVQDFSWGRAAREYLGLYEEVARGAARPSAP